MKKPLIPVYARLPLLLSLVWNLLVYQGTKLITAGWLHYDLATGLDAAVPFAPWTVCVYASWFLFWPATYVLVSRQSREAAWRLLSADFLSRAVCLVLFLALPTTNVRPALAGNGLWEWMLGLVYRLDSPCNLFPSIHCLVSWLCWLAVRNSPSFSRRWRAGTLLAALAICVSTMTTRQHVLADVPAGILLAGFCFRFVERTGFSAQYGKVMEKLNSLLLRPSRVARREGA